MDRLALAPSLTRRPLEHRDALAVCAVVNAQEILDGGESQIVVGDITSHWQRPSFDIASSTFGVFDGHRLVAFAEIMSTERADVAVHPAFRRRGIGTVLVDWVERVAIRRGMPSVDIQTAEGSPGDALLDSLGFSVRWTAWDLSRPAEAAGEPPPAIPGYTLRAAAAREYEACCDVVEDAFLEWAQRERTSFTDWSAGVVRRPGFAPWNLRVAVDVADAVVGVAAAVPVGEVVYIEYLAVSAHHRGRGLGAALIADAAWIAAEHGASTVALSTDSRSGARTLYEHLGMHGTSTWINRTKPLSYGSDAGFAGELRRTPPSLKQTTREPSSPLPGRSTRFCDGTSSAWRVGTPVFRLLTPPPVSPRGRSRARVAMHPRLPGEPRTP